jgi:hypothetical protein
MYLLMKLRYLKYRLYHLCLRYEMYHLYQLKQLRFLRCHLFLKNLKSEMLLKYQQYH